MNLRKRRHCLQGVNVDSCSPISELMFLRYIAAIFRFIVSVVVDAFKRETILVSVGKRPITEVFKLVPGFANCDSTTSVMMEHDACRIVTTIAHCVPSQVKSAFAHAVGTVCRTSGFMGTTDFFKCSFNALATAGIRLPLNKGVSLSPDDLAAGTLTLPVSSGSSTGPIGGLAGWSD